MSSLLSSSMAASISVKSFIKLSFPSFFAYWESQSHHSLESHDSCTLYFHFLNWYHQFREGFTTRWILFETVIGLSVSVFVGYWFLFFFQIQVVLTFELYHKWWYKEFCVYDVISQYIVYRIIVVIQPIEMFNKERIVWYYLDKLPIE